MAYLSNGLLLNWHYFTKSSIAHNPVFQKHKSINVMCWKTVPLYRCLFILNKVIISKYFRISKYSYLVCNPTKPWCTRTNKIIRHAYCMRFKNWENYPGNSLYNTIISNRFWLLNSSSAKDNIIFGWWWWPTQPQSHYTYLCLLLVPRQIINTKYFLISIPHMKIKLYKEIHPNISNN